MVTRSGSDDAWLVWNDCRLRWSFDGYGEGEAAADEMVVPITPASVIGTLEHGYSVSSFPAPIRD